MVAMRFPWRRKTLHMRCAACGYTWDLNARLARVRAPKLGYRWTHTDAAEAGGFWQQNRDNFEGVRDVWRPALDRRVEEVTELHECPRCGSTDVESTR